MTIFHFKHSYLNWRAIPCSGKWFVFVQFFIIFLNLTLLIFIWTWLNFSSAWHDNQFFFFFFFTFFHNFSTPGDVCHKWPSKLKHLFSCEDCFKGLTFWSKVVYVIFVRREDYSLKVFLRNGQFPIDVPQGISQDDLNVSRSWDLVLLIENVWQVWNYSKSWCIPNYQLSVPIKIHHFLLPDFWRIWEIGF